MERRIAFDIGTGMVKMAVADKGGGMLNVIPLNLSDAQTAVPLGADLEKSGNGVRLSTMHEQSLKTDFQ